MILIVSENIDHITDRVIEWLQYYSINDVFRINEDDCVNILEIDIASENAIIEVNGRKLNLQDVDFFWYRRGGLNFKQISFGIGDLDVERQKCWATTAKDDEPQGVCLLLEPTPDFYTMEGEKTNRSGFAFLFNYLRPHKKFIVQLVLGLLTGTLLQLLFPFLTQAVVDVGIATRNISFIYLVLLAQLILFISRMSVEFIRSWILLHVSTRINISLITKYDQLYL